MRAKIILEADSQECLLELSSPPVLVQEHKNHPLIMISISMAE